MSLTRNEWLEMWATVKLMETHNDSLGAMLPYAGPFREKEIRRIINSNKRYIELIKNQIQSVIGQME